MQLGPRKSGAVAYRAAVRRLLDREHRGAAVHVLCTLALSPLYALPGLLLLLGAALTPVFLVGLPLLPLAMAAAAATARAERGRLHLIRRLDIEVPTLGGGSGWRERCGRFFGRRAWRCMGFSCAMALWGLGSGVLELGLLALGLLLVLMPAIGPFLPDGATVLGLDPGSPAGLLPAFLLGVVLTGAALRLAPALARTEEALAVRLLGADQVDHLVRRVVDLEDSRSRMVDAAEQERRRIERDLHDGAQQRLLSVAMTLGRARSRFDRDPEKARLLLMTAHDEAKAAMQELRDVTRGLHPSILTEQGIAPALASVAARCPVPVDLRIELTDRPSPRAEAVAYFVVSESLTNVAKHAAATLASVRVFREDDLLRVAITDNGIGGADPARGTGLGGLHDRARAVDGHLVFSSPFGGPTTVDVTIPWRA
ncbi:histidine kinase [Streptomyces sp. NPDC089922]|uniref:sensor histidine kinase n=1 Tax=unclassified Streptomyces TaxID=2593676 RepID=UPI003417A8B3